ncbi:MAG: thioredoxin domain-containing protein [Bryobacteraceae bacterium]
MMRALPPSLVALLAAAFLAAVPPAATAQSAATSQASLQKEVEDLKSEVKALRNELDQVKQTIHDLTAPRTITFDVGGAPIMGDEAAKVVLVEFSDYQCPYCMAYFTNTYRQVVDEYVKTGKMRYVVRDFPGESIHPNALQAAEAARCATEQGKFWPMHDDLFANQKKLGSTGISDSAEAAGLDMTKFHACFDSRKYTDAVRKDEGETLKLGVKGTPAFFFGTPDPADPNKIKLSKAIVGAQPWTAFQQTIDSFLK